VNIVETVAHMMSATHYFGDVDVICDIGGQDIKVLFMQNGDIKNFKLSNQCSAGNGMLLQAMADQFGMPVTEYADTAFEAAVAQVQLRLRRLPRLRPGELPEGGLQQGGAPGRPRPGAAQERLAVRGADAAHGRARAASSCCRAAPSTTWPRVKAQVDYIKERVPDAEVYVHPHTGEAGAIGAAMETCGWSSAAAARPSSASMRPSTSSTDDATTRDQVQLLPEQLLAHLHRHPGPRRRHQPVHQRLLLREGHRRGPRRAASDLNKERKRIA
jgi:hypothetical protein